MRSGKVELVGELDGEGRWNEVLGEGMRREDGRSLDEKKENKRRGDGASTTTTHRGELPFGGN